MMKKNLSVFNFLFNPQYEEENIVYSRWEKMKLKEKSTSNTRKKWRFDSMSRSQSVKK